MSKNGKVTPEGTNVEESLNRLGEIVEKLESEETTLEEAITLYQEGHRLARSCRELLSKAELVVTDLVAEDSDSD